MVVELIYRETLGVLQESKAKQYIKMHSILSILWQRTIWRTLTVVDVTLWR